MMTLNTSTRAYISGVGLVRKHQEPVEEMDVGEAIRSELETIPNIEEIKPEPVLILTNIEDGREDICLPTVKAELQQHVWVNCDPERNYGKLLIGIFYNKILPQNKERLLRSLRGEGSCRVVVATTALGMGLNFPNVSHIVMYGVPGDLETIVQQVGRAGRHGQPSHAILYNTSMYMNVDKEDKELISTANDKCLRKSLYTHFEEEPISVEPGHQCCTFCHSMCSCSPGTCAEPIPNDETTQSKPVSLRSRQVNATDKSLFADLLNDYRTSLINFSTPLFTRGMHRIQSRTGCFSLEPLPIYISFAICNR